MRGALWRAGQVAAVVLAAGCQTAEASAQPERSAEAAERVAAALQRYVYASYDVLLLEEAADDAQAEAELERLAAAREALARHLGRIGIDPEEAERGVAAFAPDLMAYFEVASDLVFLPLAGGDGGLALVRAAERRDMVDRPVAGRPTTYQVVLHDETVIEGLARYRAGPDALGPVARSSGRTIYLDRPMARRTARELVIGRLAAMAELAGRAADGASLADGEVKDLLRHRALAPAAAEGGERAVAAAILRQEEARLAGLFAAAGDRDPLAVTADDEVEALVREATLRGVVAGDPRYQLASALALLEVAPGTPAAAGAGAALRAAAGGDGAAALLGASPDALKRRAAAALAALEQAPAQPPGGEERRR